MFYDKKYNYSFIDNYEFDSKWLMCKKDGSKYKRYILLFYKDNTEIKSVELPSEEYLKNFTNVVKYYNVEEIISSTNYFDSMYKEIYYYRIDNKETFIKYIFEDNTEHNQNDNEEIKKYLDSLYIK